MKTSKFPKFSQWKQIFKVLKKSEKITLTNASLGQEQYFHTVFDRGTWFIC